MAEAAAARLHLAIRRQARCDRCLCWLISEGESGCVYDQPPRGEPRFGSNALGLGDYFPHRSTGFIWWLRSASAS